MKKLLFLVILCIFYQCKNKTILPKNVVEQSITVFYLTGKIDANHSIKCDFLLENSEIDRQIADTVYVSKEKYLRIQNFINNSLLNDKIASCDARILLKSNDAQLCIGDINCVLDENNMQVKKDLNDIYIIKKISGYYNYLKKEDLIFDNAIKTFGIPDNYKYINDNKEGVKVLLISK